VDGKMALAPTKRDALGHGPAREGAVPLEPEVVVETTRGMALDDEGGQRALSALGTERLGGLVGPPAAPVLVERHLWIVAINATLSSPNSRKMGDSPAQRGFQSRG
jgi:hypothetical protein